MQSSVKWHYFNVYSFLTICNLGSYTECTELCHINNTEFTVFFISTTAGYSAILYITDQFYTHCLQEISQY